MADRTTTPHEMDTRDFDDFEDAEEFWQDDDVDFDHDYVLLDDIFA